MKEGRPWRERWGRLRTFRTLPFFLHLIEEKLRIADLLLLPTSQHPWHHSRICFYIFFPFYLCFPSVDLDLSLSEQRKGQRKVATRLHPANSKLWSLLLPKCTFFCSIPFLFLPTWAEGSWRIPILSLMPAKQQELVFVRIGPAYTVSFTMLGLPPCFPFHAQHSLMRPALFIFSFCTSGVLNQGRWSPRVVWQCLQIPLSLTAG